MTHRRNVIIATGLALALGARIWPSWTAWNEGLRAETTQLQRRARWLAQLSSGRAAAMLDTHRTLAASASRSFLSAVGDDRGASALSSVIAQYAADAGLVLGPARVIAEDALALEASATGDVSGLMQFLLLVEQGTPRLHLTALVIGATRSHPLPASETLDIRFRIQGYVQAATVDVREPAAHLVHAGATP